MNLSLPNALLNVVLSCVIAWQAHTIAVISGATDSPLSSPAVGLTAPPESVAPFVVTKGVMPIDRTTARSSDRDRSEFPTSDTAPPVASGGAPIVPSRTHLRTWACTDAAGTHLCDVDTNEVLDGPEFASWQHRTYMDAAVPFEVRVREMYYTPPAVTKELAQKTAQAAQKAKEGQ